jgi:hypothetical protein
LIVAWVLQEARLRGHAVDSTRVVTLWRAALVELVTKRSADAVAVAASSGREQV